MTKEEGLQKFIETIDEWKVYRSDTKVPDIPMDTAQVIGSFSRQITMIIRATGNAPSCLCCREKLEVNEHDRANPGAMVVGIEKGKAITASAICYACAGKTDIVIITIMKAAISLMLAGGADGGDAPPTRH